MCGPPTHEPVPSEPAADPMVAPRKSIDPALDIEQSVIDVPRRREVADAQPGTGVGIAGDRGEDRATPAIAPAEPVGFDRWRHDEHAHLPGTPDLRRQGRRASDVERILDGLRALKAQSVAEESNRRLRELVAIVAHELRNPLAPIRSAASALTHARPEELARLQAVIERQVSQASKLVADLLDVARIELGVLRLDVQEIDLKKIIHEAVDDCMPAFVHRAQHFDLEMPPAAPLQMRADGGRLIQILTNLLDNASKYTPEGGDIGLSVTTLDDEVMIVVSDNGVGISQQTLPHIFEAFLRDTNASNLDKAGLGIGLCVVRELVEAHGGSIVAWSDGVDQGSRFVVKLPMTG